MGRARSAVLEPMTSVAPSSPRWGGTSAPRAPEPAFGTNERAAEAGDAMGDAAGAGARAGVGSGGGSAGGGGGGGLMREEELKHLAARGGDTPGPGDYKIAGGAGDIAHRAKSAQHRNWSTGGTGPRAKPVHGRGGFVFGRSHGDAQAALAALAVSVDIPDGSVNHMSHPAFGSRSSVPTVFPGTAATDPATHIASAPRRAPFNGSLRHGGAGEQGPVGRHWDRPGSARAWGRTGEQRSSPRWGLPDIARHVIDTRFRPSSLELNGATRRGEQYLPDPIPRRRPEGGRNDRG